MYLLFYNTANFAPIVENIKETLLKIGILISTL